MEQLENVATVYPLTQAQKGLLYQILLAETDALYRTQSRDNVHGAFDIDIFKQSIELLVDRHESLRCLFLHVGLDDPAVVVRQTIELPWQEHDLRELSSEQQQLRLDEIAADNLAEPFHLDQAPLMRVTVARLSNELSQVIFDIHHLIFDGWSSVLFFNELQSIYGAFAAGMQPELPSAGKFSEYVTQLEPQNNEDIAERWADKLSGFEQATSLQLDVTSAHDAEHHTDASFRASLDSLTTRKLNELARSTRTTLSTLMEAAWALTLARYNNTDDVVIGVTLNGRSNALNNHDRTFGMFVNALPMRLKCQPSASLNKWLADAQQEKAQLTQNDQISMADIHVASELPAGVDLFDALLVFQTFPDLGAMGAPPINFSNMSVHENSPLPLLIHIFESQQLDFLIMHSQAMLPGASAQQLIKHYLAVLSSLANVKQADTTKIGDITMLDSDDRRLLLDTYNTPDESPSVAGTLQSLFLQQARKTPNAIAVSDNHQSLSYQALESAASALCNYLIANQVKRGDTVAVVLERSTDVFTAMLGSMMAGAMFVPIDPGYPASRQSSMLTSSGATLVLSNSTTRRLFDEQGVNVVEMDTLQDAIAAAPSSAPELGSATGGAYVMFTSGSTGLAKGVVGSHAATLNRFQWMWQTYPFQTTDVMCQKTSLSFVDSIWELFGGLLQGIHTVVIADDVVRNAHQFVDALERHKVSRIVLLPSYLSVLLDSVEDIASRLSAISLWVVSGEPLSRNIAQQFLAEMPERTLLNLYGSTEVSADVTSMEIGSQQLSASMPIGKPITDCQIYILSAAKQLMPPGATGELCVAGRGLSLGYFNEEDGLNKEKFIDNPFGEGKLYLTGDLGRYIDDGIIEHQGRKDAQLKISGYRIEPVEIEQTIAGFDGIRAVLVNAPGENKLHAYYRVMQGASVDHAELTRFVTDRLPEYMVPQVLQELDEFPRLPNGKISRKDLPDPTIEIATRRVAPRTTTEKTVADLWQRTLHGPDPSIFDNFVASGGSSLSGMRFNARLYREFGKMVLPRMLLTANLAQLAAYINPDDVIDGDNEQLDVDLMEPIFFEQGDHRLFGMLHLPGGKPKPQAVLLCPSIAHEYMRLHRGYQMLAIELARRGYFVLRYDLFGFGDSDGIPAQARMEIWQQDVQAAAQYLKRRSELDTVTLVGVRLGAPLMMGADIDNVDKAIMLDPVCSGPAYLQYLDQLHQYAMSNLDRYRYRQRKAHQWERFGYTYSEQLSKDLLSMQLAPLLDQSDAQLHLITTGDVVSTNDMNVSQLLEDARVNHQHVADINLWSDYDQASYLAFLQPAVNRIISVIEE